MPWIQGGLTSPEIGQKFMRLLSLGLGSPPGRLALRESLEGNLQGDGQARRAAGPGRKRSWDYSPGEDRQQDLIRSSGIRGVLRQFSQSLGSGYGGQNKERNLIPSIRDLG